MTDPTTTNRSLYIPSRGSNSGTWDTPLNANFAAIDTLFGGLTTVSLSSSNVTLSTSQCQNAIIRFTGALSANVSITFPTVYAIYTVENLTTGNYTVTCKMAAGNVVAVPQGIPTQIFTDGSNTKFWNTVYPGTYWDLATTATPSWITACTVKPWLICDGTVYNISDYPYLGGMLGSTFGGNGVSTFGVPDLRNKVRVSLKSSSPLLTSAVSGINGATFGASSTAEGCTLTESHIPAHTHSGTTAAGGSHNHTIPMHSFATVSGGSPYTLVEYGGATTNTSTAAAHTHSFTTDSGTGGGAVHTSVQPTLVAGITLIKT